MSRILVIGGGFAGLMAALGAVRAREEAGARADSVSVAVVNRDPYHAIRVRNYEADLSDARMPLEGLLSPAGVDLIEGETESIDTSGRTVEVRTSSGRETLPYDRLVLAAGSRLNRPAIPGVAEHAFSIDTYDEAAALGRHIEGLASEGDEQPGRLSAVVVGGGLTGIEAVCEMPGRLRAVAGDKAGQVRVVLVDRKNVIGASIGAEAREVVGEALDSLGIERRTGVEISGLDKHGISFADGGRIDARTVIWTTGLRASPLAEDLGVPLDSLGRAAVDPFMKVEGVEGVYAAGDVAVARFEDGHASVMSCQQGRPMGRIAGRNAARDLLGLEGEALVLAPYVTCFDLGPWGAMFTRGWERRITNRGPEAKPIKQDIACVRIYPPRPPEREALLNAAAPMPPPEGSPALRVRP